MEYFLIEALEAARLKRQVGDQLGIQAELRNLKRSAKREARNDPIATCREGEGRRSGLPEGSRDKN